jgi:Domain of unknown function (DUF4157)
MTVRDGLGTAVGERASGRSAARVRVPEAQPAPGRASRFAAAADGPPRAADVLALQRAAGNRETRRMLAASRGHHEREADAIARRVVDSGRVDAGELSRLRGAPTPPAASVAPDFDAALRRSRAGGQPLPETIKATMQPAFGSDLSGVRIHSDDGADRLSGRLRARAFTTGRDIFFRRGQYQPATRRGQELIAHELTHVMQQGGSDASGAIQCALGVELECSDLEIRPKPFNAKKGDLIQGGYMWKMIYEETSEGAAVAEFVLEPAAEHEGQFLSGVLGMSREAKRIWNNAFIEYKRNGVKYEVHSENNAGVKADPQLTMGLPLANIPAVFPQFETLQSSGTHQLYKQLMQGNGLPTPDGGSYNQLPAETQGFFLLLFDYLKRGFVPKHEKRDKVPFEKGIFDVMSRTDFVTIFRALPPAQRQRLATLDIDGRSVLHPKWVDWLIAVGLSGAGSVDELREDQLINQHIKGSGKPGAPPVRGEWLSDMPRRDRLAEQGYLGLGEYGSKTDVVESSTTKAPIIELRRPEGGSVDYRDWPNKAIEWWDLYQKIIGNQTILRGKRDKTS